MTNVQDSFSFQPSNLSTQKVAIVHDILDRYGGAERVVEALLDAFPQADLFVSRYTDNPQIHKIVKRFQVDKLSSYMKDKKFIKKPQTLSEQSKQPANSPTLYSSFMQHLPFFKHLAKFYTPLYPYAFESFDLRNYDVVISSTAHFAKGVITTESQIHICYCHTPPRFLYHYPTETTKRDRSLFKPLVQLLDHTFRSYDFIIAQRPDIVVTNSENTARRVRKFYRRESNVIYPPVDINKFKVEKLSGYQVKQVEKQKILQPATLSQQSEQLESTVSDGYYIYFSRLLPYKKVDVIIKAFNQLGDNLIVIGDGAQRAYLESIAGKTITFMGYLPDTELIKYVKNAQALVFNTPDEDFGIVMVESLAAGTPVIAVKGGGALEIVQDGVNGVLYDTPSIKGIITGVARFKGIKDTLDTQTIMNSSQKFSKERFIKEIKKLVEGYQDISSKV